MSKQPFSCLQKPTVVPVLDSSFRPAVLANRVFREAVEKSGSPVDVTLALEQADGSVFHHATRILPDDHAQARDNVMYVERLVKFLLWSRGGYKVYVAGAPAVAEKLGDHYSNDATGVFDADIMGNRIPRYKDY